MTHFLLDTNIVSDLIRHPQGRVAGRIRTVGEGNVCTSLIVAAELRFGALKRGSRALTSRVEAILGVLEIIPLETPVDQVYAQMRVVLEKAGRPVGANDMLIAAQALAHGHTVVTDNLGEFSQVEGLSLENWLA